MTAIMIDAALRSLVLAAIVALGLRLLRVTYVPARKAAWTLVLVFSMAMPLLMQWPATSEFGARFAWVVPVRRSFAAATPPVAATPVTAAVAAEPVPAVETPDDPPPQASEVTNPDPVLAVAPASAARRSWQWPLLQELVPIVYLVVSGALLLRLLWGLVVAARLWMTAEEVSPLLAPEPNVRMSDKISSPVTVGRGVVLPRNCTEWSRAKLRVVLAHERSHVRQMDFHLQLLAGLYSAVFWFSPLGWWLKRTLSALGEAISDRAGMEVAASRSDYAGVLLEFASLPTRALPGVAMARPGNLSRRVEAFLNEGSFRRAFAEGRRRAFLSLLLIPAAVFGVTALVRMPSAAAQTQTVPQATGQEPATGQSNPPESQVTTVNPEPEENPSAPAPAQSPAVTPQRDAQRPAPTPEPPALPEHPAASPAPEPQNAPGSGPMVLDMGPTPDVRVPHMKVVVPKIPDLNMLAREMPEIHALTLHALEGDMTGFGPYGAFYLGQNDGMNGYAYHFTSNGDSWAIVEGTGKNTSMSGAGMTRDELDLAQRMAKGPFLWFSHRGKSYIVDDPAIVARIRSLYAPMKELGRQQQALGLQQRVLGRMDEELARQERDNSDVRIPDLSKEMTSARAALDKLQSEQGQMLSQEKLGELQAELAEMEARLGSLEARAAMQNHFGDKMRALGEQQRQLGDQERELGEQQKKLEQQAQQQVQSIIDQSLQNGKAMPLK